MKESIPFFILIGLGAFVVNKLIGEDDEPENKVLKAKEIRNELNRINRERRRLVKLRDNLELPESDEEQRRG